MFCSKCGSQCAEGEAFCGVCGAPLNSAPVQEQTPSYAPEQTYAQPQQTYAQPQQAYAQPQQPYVQPQQGYQGQQYGGFYAAPQQSETPKKKGGKKLAITIVSIVVALGLIAGGIFLFWPKSDEKIFKTTEKEEIENVVDDAIHLYKIAADVKSGDEKLAGVLKLNLSVDQNLLGSLAGGQVDLSWLSDIGLTATADSAENANAVSAEVTISGKKIITVEYKTDAEAGKAYIRLPELSDKYIALDLEDVKEIVSSKFDMRQLMNSPALDSFGFDVSGLLDSDMTPVMNAVFDNVSDSEIETLITRYAGMFIDNIETVEAGKETLEAEGISEEFKKLEVTLSQKDVMEIVKKIAGELKDDGDFKGIVDKVAPALAAAMSSESFSVSEDMLKEEIYGILEMIAGGTDGIFGDDPGYNYDYDDDDYDYDYDYDDYDYDYDDDDDDDDDDDYDYGYDDDSEGPTDEPFIYFALYVDGDGEAKGHHIEVTPDSYTKYVFDTAETTADGKTGFKISFDMGDGNGFVMSGKGSKVGDLFTGDAALTVTANGEELSIAKLTFDKFDFETPKDLKLNGKITFSPGAGLIKILASKLPENDITSGLSNNEQLTNMLTMLTFTMDFEREGNTQKFDIALGMSGMNLLSLNGEWQKGDTGLDLSAPSSGSVVDVNDSESLSEWTKGLDFEGLVNRLKEAGVPTELFEGLANLTGMSPAVDYGY